VVQTKSYFNQQPKMSQISVVTKKIVQ
jgi:hypothetical protein